MPVISVVREGASEGDVDCSTHRTQSYVDWMSMFERQLVVRIALWLWYGFGIPIPRRKKDRSFAIYYGMAFITLLWSILKIKKSLLHFPNFISKCSLNVLIDTISYIFIQ